MHFPFGLCWVFSSMFKRKFLVFYNNNFNNYYYYYMDYTGEGLGEGKTMEDLKVVMGFGEMGDGVEGKVKQGGKLVLLTAENGEK